MPGAKTSSPASMAYWMSRSRWARQTWWSLVAQPICAPSRSETQKSGRTLAEELGDHRLAPRGPDDEAGAVAMVEDPGPEGPAADPHAGLVGLQDGAGQQAVADRARLPLERRGAGLQHVGQRALADLQPEQVEQQPLQALERDRLAEAQVEHEGAQVRRQTASPAPARPGRRPEPPWAAGAEAAMQRDPGDVRA